MERDARGVAQPEAVLEPHMAREHRRAHRAGREPPAFLVGPGDQVERPLRRDPGVVQRFERLEPGEHAEDAIEPPARRLAVHVRAGDDRGCVRIAPGPAHEQIGDGIDRREVAARRRPLQKQRAGAHVIAGQRLPADAAAGNLADLGHRHVAPPQPLLIDRRGGAPRRVADAHRSVLLTPERAALSGGPAGARGFVEHSGAG